MPKKYCIGCVIIGFIISYNLSLNICLNETFSLYWQIQKEGNQAQRQR